MDDWEVQKVAYEEKIRDLAVRLEQEREARAEDVRKAARALKQSRAEMEARIEDVRRRSEAEVAAANARAREAEDTAEAALKRVDEEVAAVRRQAESRVAEARMQTEARVGERSEQYRESARQMQAALEERQRSSAQEVELERRRKELAVDEKRRHVEAIERECEEQRTMQEANFAVKQARLDEWRAQQKKQIDEATQRNRTLIELEKSLHNRSLERTMGRIARHMTFGDGDVRGDETPTRQALQRAVLDDVPWMPETPRTGRRHFGLVGEAVVDGPVR